MGISVDAGWMKTGAKTGKVPGNELRNLVKPLPVSNPEQLPAFSVSKELGGL
jgi:hypothetical protein